MEEGEMRLEYRQAGRKILNSANSIVEISWNFKNKKKKKKSLSCIQTSSVATCHILKNLIYKSTYYLIIRSLRLAWQALVLRWATDLVISQELKHTILEGDAKVIINADYAVMDSSNQPNLYLLQLVDDIRSLLVHWF